MPDFMMYFNKIVLFVYRASTEFFLLSFSSKWPENAQTLAQ